MFRSLSWKLGGALLLVVVVSVVLTAYLANRSTSSEFTQYVSYGNQVYAQNVSDNLSRFYSQRQSWSGVQDTLTSLSRGWNDRLIVADNADVIVGDTDRDWLGRNAKDVDLSNGIPITVSNKEAGKLYLLTAYAMMGMGGMGKGGMMGGWVNPPSSQVIPEQDFLSRINSSLWLSGFIAAAVALLLGLLLTRQITRPVRALTSAARGVARGRFDSRVKVSSKDELGEMAQSFNSMASSLEGSEQSRRRLTADIAHELRTPLTVIEGTVDAMLDGVYQPDREHLGSIKEEVALLTRLIGDLRDLSLAESGQLKLELAPADIVALVNRKLSQVEVTAREKGIRMKLDAPEKIPEVQVDSTRIEQVIANLLTNAIRHTPSGGSIIVSVRTMAGDRSHRVDKPSLMISVADTGEGIAPEHLPHIFERFYRVEDSRSRSEGGSGLGLAIVKQMVQAHGGVVWAESKPGEGSEFYVAIPLNGK